MGQGWWWRMACMNDKVNGLGRISGDSGAFSECEVIH